MTDFFLEGGWTMWPTALFGFLAVVSSLLIAWKPERRFVPLLLSLGALTTVAGISGTVMALIGVLKAAAHSGGEERYTIVLAGTAESLNNVVLAFTETHPHRPTRPHPGRGGECHEFDQGSVDAEPVCRCTPVPGRLRGSDHRPPG